MLRVKKGPCAPLRFISMLSWPATGITSSSVTSGAPWWLPALLVDDMDISLGFPGPSIKRSEVVNDERPSHILLRDRVEGIRLLQNLGGKYLAVLRRSDAE